MASLMRPRLGRVSLILLVVAAGPVASAQKPGPEADPVVIRAGVVSIPDPEGRVLCVDISADGSRVVIGDEAGGLKIRDAVTGKVTKVLHDDPPNPTPEDLDKPFEPDQKPPPFEQGYWPVRAVAFAPDGSRVAAAIPCLEAVPGRKDGEAERLTFKVRVWDLKSGQLLPSRDGDPSDVRALTFARSADRIHTLDVNARLSSWDLRSGQLVASFGEWPRMLLISNPVDWDTAFGGGGNRAISVMDDWDGVGDPKTSSTIKLWDFERKEFRIVSSTPLGGGAPSKSATLSPDGRLGAIVGNDGFVHFFDFDRVQTLGRFKLPDDQGTIALKFSPDGQRLIAVGERGLARICEAPGGQAGPAFKGPAGAVRAIRWLPDRIIFVSGGFELIPAKVDSTPSSVEAITIWSYTLDKLFDSRVGSGSLK